MKAIRKFFQIIDRLLDSAFKIVNELCSWVDEGVAESETARKEMQEERNKAIAEAAQK
jgi:hypothetical protein